MITAVDTNILVDIFIADVQFGEASKAAFKRCATEGAIYACEVVWTEVATVFDNTTHCLEAMTKLGIDFSPLTQDTSLHAAKAWRQYRQAGGKRERVVADFLIGAHAWIQCDRLLTRDRGFYRSYFKTLSIFDPTK